MKTKYTSSNKPASAPMTDTSRAMPSAKLPAVDAVGLPASAGQFMGAGMSVNPSANAPQATQDTESLAMFNASAGYTDTGASTSGDVGGAA